MRDAMRWNLQIARDAKKRTDDGGNGDPPHPSPPHPRSIDKGKFFVVGTGLFSGLTTVLFPLSVIKTRMMAIDAQAGPRGGIGVSATVRAVRSVLAKDGVMGLYRGFPMAVLGSVPARALYLSTLEIVKARTVRTLEATTSLERSSVVVCSSYIGGACASLATQTISVPVDVIAQQQMVSENRIGLSAKVRSILAKEGIRGFYRGYWTSLALFVPTSSMWWGTYSLYKEVLWGALPDGAPHATADAERAASGQLAESGGDSVLEAGIGARTGFKVVGVQALAAVCSGCTTSLFTTPLDVIKTRVQTSEVPLKKASEVWGVCKGLVQREGVAGLYRGLFPRMTASSVFGSTMVLAYEFLKRICVKEGMEEEGLR